MKHSPDTDRARAYANALARTWEYLWTPRTPAEIAERFNISVFAAYARLRALKGKVRRLRAVVLGPAGKRGPKAHAWQAR